MASFRVQLRAGLSVLILSALFNLWQVGPYLQSRWRLGCRFEDFDRTLALLVLGGPLLGIVASAALLIYFRRRGGADRPAPEGLGCMTGAYQVFAFVCVTGTLSILTQIGRELDRVARC